MKLLLAFACLTVACFGTGCQTTEMEGEIPPPPESDVYLINPGTP